jgi:hypothetical protein
MTVVPAETPVTTPEEVTVAMPVSVLLHTPPGATSLREVVDDAHMVLAPVIVPAKGSAFTVTTLVAAAVPQPLVTV